MKFEIEKSNKKNVEGAIKNAIEAGFFGTLGDDVLERMKNVRVQTRDGSYFDSPFALGEYRRSRKTITIRRALLSPELELAVLHETAHAVQEALYQIPDDFLMMPEDEKFYALCKKMHTEETAYKNEVAAFLQDKLGKDYDVLHSSDCLFAWAFNRYGLYGHSLSGEAFIDHGPLFWQMTLRCDIMMGWPLGTVMGYSADEAVQDILADSKQIAYSPS